MKIFGELQSGNCLKVKWTADALGIPYTWIETGVRNGLNRQPAYLAKFPFGQVPGIELDDGRCLAQSNAIIRYLAAGSRLLPAETFAQAKVDEWLFWEQYSHEPYIAVCRFHMLYKGEPRATRDPVKVERGEKALDFMDARLAGRSWLAGEAITVADIALLAYTRVAHEGGFDLGSRPHVRAWIARGEKELNI